MFTSIDFAGFGKKKGRVKIKSEKERLIGYDPSAPGGRFCNGPPAARIERILKGNVIPANAGNPGQGHLSAKYELKNTRYLAFQQRKIDICAVRHFQQAETNMEKDKPFYLTRCKCIFCMLSIDNVYLISSKGSPSIFVSGLCPKKLNSM